MKLVRQLFSQQQDEVKRTIETVFAQHVQSLNSVIAQERTDALKQSHIFKMNLLSYELPSIDSLQTRANVLGKALLTRSSWENLVKNQKKL